jgi:hypothetical protein
VRFRKLRSTGAWRSLVAHSAGGRKVAGSNPVAPMIPRLASARRAGVRTWCSPCAPRQLPRGLTLVDTPPGEPQRLVRCERDVTGEPHPAREPRIPGPPAWHGICDRRFRHVRYGPPHHERGSPGGVFRHPYRGQSWPPWSWRRRPGAAHPSRTRRRIEGPLRERDEGAGEEGGVGQGLLERRAGSPCGPASSSGRLSRGRC